MKTIAIVGSQDLTGPQQTVARELICAIILSQRPPFTVVSGGAPGIDTLVCQVMDEFKKRSYQNQDYIDFYEILPNNHRWDPDGYKDRNIKIAAACHDLWAIRSRQSMTYGSGWTADFAEAMGKRVFRVYV